jgi:hypothetical protein
MRINRIISVQVFDSLITEVRLILGGNWLYISHSSIPVLAKVPVIYLANLKIKQN